MDGGADEGHSFAWNDSETFIIWVPYGTNIKDDSGTLTTIDASYCTGNLQGSDDDKILTVCDASNGMARIFNQNGGLPSLLATPQGWNANYQVWTGEAFSTSDAIRGSVASWLKGNFEYDISQQFSSLLNGGNIDASALEGLQVSQSTAGYFNIPVCRVLDLRSFPPSNANNQEFKDGMCLSPLFTVRW